VRILFVVFSLPGHLNPLLSIAQHLEHAGHDVELASMDDISERVVKAGLAARCHIAGTWRRPPNPGRRAELAAVLRNPRIARLWYQHMLISPVPAEVVALREIVRASRPDVIATDALAYAGAIVAQQEQVPWASISTQLLALAPPEFHCPYMRYLDELATARDRLFSAEGITLRCARGEAISPWLSTVFATDALALASSDHATCVGPPVALGGRGDEATLPWDRLRGDKPVVYISFGSHLAPPNEVLESAANALTAHEADVILATGDADIGSLPAHVIAVPWAPQLSVLERARVMITHGGANSVAEALRYGVPLLVLPLGHEQALQAHLIERSGAGLALALEHTSRTAFATALRTLLADGPHRARAAELGRSYASANGSQRAAELLVGLAPRASA
jgi:zeaxanthin glucosyltransferase